jgi:hypothetical protein
MRSCPHIAVVHADTNCPVYSSVLDMKFTQIIKKFPARHLTQKICSSPLNLSWARWIHPVTSYPVSLRLIFDNVLAYLQASVHINPTSAKLIISFQQMHYTILVFSCPYTCFGTPCAILSAIKFVNAQQTKLVYHYKNNTLRMAQGVPKHM